MDKVGSQPEPRSASVATSCLNKTNKLRGFSPPAKYIDQATAAC
jgi:hypothetical protein